MERGQQESACRLSANVAPTKARQAEKAEMVCRSLPYIRMIGAGSIFAAGRSTVAFAAAAN